MYALALLLVFMALVYQHSLRSEAEIIVIPKRIGSRLTHLWEIAHHGMRENRFLRAEKALLTILKIDEKNAAAYNRLGILYAKQHEYKDAIDCFEIASSIEPSASSLHNLGLIYFETENYQKAATAFEEALKLEENLAARHIAYAKVQEKIGNQKLVIQELERAVELESSPTTLRLLMTAYEDQGMIEEAKIIRKKISRLPPVVARSKRLNRPRRVVI